MLLDDGAHFSLLEPRLQELRRLIEEARSLSDSPSASLRISRYQAGLWAELAALGVVTEQAQAWQRQVGALLELDAIAEHDPPADAGCAAAPLPARRVRLAGVAVGARARRDPRRRHGARQDAAGARADLPRARARPGRRSVPGGRADERRLELGGGGGPLRSRAAESTRSPTRWRGPDARSRRSPAADVVVTTYTLFRLEADAYRTVAGRA